MDSICWLIAGIVLFVIAIVTDKELRDEFKDIRYCVCMITVVIALYGAIMWIAKMWLQWCL